MTDSMDDVINEKLIDLEIRITHQEDDIEQLNNTIYQQQKNLEQLSQQMDVVVKRLKTMMESQILSADEETPPPHY